MESIRVAWSIGIVALAFSVDGLGQPPEGKGKRPQGGHSPFIEFPVPHKSVGVVHSRVSHLPPGLQGKGEGGAPAKLKRAELETALPMTTSGFPSMPKGTPVPECISR
jgi:hypothetical protein